MPGTSENMPMQNVVSMKDIQRVAGHAESATLKIHVLLRVKLQVL